VRIETLLRELLALEYTRVVNCEFDDQGLVVDVTPTWRNARCSGCSHDCPTYDRRARAWRHLDLAGMKFVLRYDMRRVDCVRCGVVVEYVPWADVGSRFTRPFEDQVGYLAQRSDKTSVSTLMRVAWKTVGDIVRRVVKRHGSDRLLDGLTHIGVDELSYRRHHEYVTVVVDHVRGHIVWARKGKNADTLKAFFEQLGPRSPRTSRSSLTGSTSSASLTKPSTRSAEPRSASSPRQPRGRRSRACAGSCTRTPGT
jgi:transposase